MKKQSVRNIFKHSELIRFAIVGTIATGIHYISYYLLCYISTTNIAYSVGYLISLAFNFLSSARFTFRSSPSFRHAMGFILSHLVNWGLQITVLNIAIYLNVAEEIAPIPVYIICVPINFILVRYVFKH